MHSSTPSFLSSSAKAMRWPNNSRSALTLRVNRLLVIALASVLMAGSSGEAAPFGGPVAIAPAPPPETTIDAPITDTRRAVATVFRRDVPATRDATAEPINTVRPSALAFLIENLAGQTLRIRHARVVGVLNPRVLLIESATSFPAMLGTRDRVLVLLAGGAALRVAPATLVGASVTVLGIARTLLGVQVTNEVSWPSELTREAVNRLEIRAAVLASSVQTADGVELTDRTSPNPPAPSAAPTGPPAAAGRVDVEIGDGTGVDGDLRLQ